MDPSSTVCLCYKSGRADTVVFLFSSVLAMATGPWCSSAAATDTHAGGVRVSRASSGITGRPSSGTTASARLHRSRRTSQPNGKTAGGGAGGWGGQAFPSVGILRGKENCSNPFYTFICKEIICKESGSEIFKHGVFSVPLRGRYGNV